MGPIWFRWVVIRFGKGPIWFRWVVFRCLPVANRRIAGIERRELNKPMS